MDYRKILESRYDRKDWQDLLHDIFHQKVQFWQQPQQVPVDKTTAKQALYMGKITLSDGNILAVYELYARRLPDLLEVMLQWRFHVLFP